VEVVLINAYPALTSKIDAVAAGLCGEDWEKSCVLSKKKKNKETLRTNFIPMD
jgi:hypothetical protein